jgi:hypothetical protein
VKAPAHSIANFPELFSKHYLATESDCIFLQAVGYTIFLVTVGPLYFQKLGGQPNVASKITESAREQAS